MTEQPASEDDSALKETSVIDLSHQHRFSFRKKKYLLQSRTGGRGPFQTTLQTDKLMSAIEIEASHPELWDEEGHDYIFGETKDGKTVINPVWIVKRKNRPVARQGSAATRLVAVVGDVEKELTPLITALDALRGLGDKINGIGRQSTDGTEDAGMGDGIEGSTMVEVMANMNKAYAAAMLKMGENFANSLSGMSGLGGYNLPSNAPMWAQMVTNANFRVGMREITRDLVDEVIESVKNGAAELMAKVAVDTGGKPMTSLADIVEQVAPIEQVKVEPEADKGAVMIDVPPQEASAASEEPNVEASDVGGDGA